MLILVVFIISALDDDDDDDDDDEDEDAMVEYSQLKGSLPSLTVRRAAAPIAALCSWPW